MKDKKNNYTSHVEILLAYANSIIDTLREPFLVLDTKLEIISANQVFYTTFKVAEKDIVGRLFYDLGNKEWNIPRLIMLLEEIISKKKVVKNYEVKCSFEQLGERVMLLNACHLRVNKKTAKIIAAEIKEKKEKVEASEEEEEELILLAIEDITERKRLVEELKEAEERYRRAFETSRDGLLLVHKAKGIITNSNESIQELLGYSHKELLGKKLWEIGVVKDCKDFEKIMAALEKNGVINFEDTKVKTKKGSSPISSNRVTPPAASLVCSVEKTKWPVNAARIAISAVS